MMNLAHQEAGIHMHLRIGRPWIKHLSLPKTHQEDAICACSIYGSSEDGCQQLSQVQRHGDISLSTSSMSKQSSCD